jgi:hypothetical protein
MIKHAPKAKNIEVGEKTFSKNLAAAPNFRQ